MPETITIYKSDHCGGCKQIVPIVKRLAKKKGISVKVVDVEKCDEQGKCDEVKYVPYVKIGNREVTDMRELAKILK